MSQHSALSQKLNHRGHRVFTEENTQRWPVISARSSVVFLCGPLCSLWFKLLLLTMTNLFLFPESLVSDTSPHLRTPGYDSLPLAWARKRTSASPVLRMLKNNPDL